MIDKNTPAFPVPEYEGHNGERAFRSPVQEGMTYRQWLIGTLSESAVDECIEALSNWPNRMRLLGIDPETKNVDPLDVVIQSRAMLRIMLADAIIDRLNKEDKQ